MELINELTKNQEAFPGEIHETAGGGIVVSSFDGLINWARSNSLWPLTFATSCCGIEMMSTASAKYDFSRFGFEVARASPRQADVFIFSCKVINACNKASGRGGQPGIYTSTGIIWSAPFTTE